MMKFSRFQRFLSLASCFCGFHVWENRQQTCRPVPCELWKRQDDGCGEECKIAAAPVKWDWCKDCGNVQLTKLNLEGLRKAGCLVSEEPIPLTWEECGICHKRRVVEVTERPRWWSKWVDLWREDENPEEKETLR